MRTKALLALALSSAGMSLAVGQTVSQNIVGYINITAAPGLSMIANQLDNKIGNEVKDLIATAPDNTTLYKWTGTGFQVNTFFTPAWDTPAMTLNPGEGAFISNPGTTPLTLLMVGEVKLGAQTVQLPAGLSIISSVVPIDLTVGDMTTGGAATFPAADADVIYQWTGTAYTVNTFFAPAWDTPTATIKVGESVFFANAGAAKTWSRTFQVN